MVHVLALCSRWSLRRGSVSSVLGTSPEDGAQLFACAVLRSSVHRLALQEIVTWAWELDSEQYAFWQAR